MALVFSGEQDGYLEPCGCAGLENQKGGLQRRFTMLKELRDKGWPVIAMDGGGQEKRHRRCRPGSSSTSRYRALAKMGYEAVGFGENDLKLDLLCDRAQSWTSYEPARLGQCGNRRFRKRLYEALQDRETGGMKIGITTVLGRKESPAQERRDLTVMDPNKRSPEILPDLVNAKCDHLVLVVNGEPDEAKELAQVPGVRLGAGDARAPRAAEEPTKIEGTKAHLIEVGHKGEYVVVVGFYKNGDPSFRYQRVPLDHRFPDAPEIHKMQVEYQNQLERWGSRAWASSRRRTRRGRKFAGSKACADCHTQAAAVFEKTPHAHATETLLKRPTRRGFMIPNA